MSGELCGHKPLLINLSPNIPFRIGMKSSAVCAVTVFCWKFHLSELIVSA
jgi:hypothetical protein